MSQSTAPFSSLQSQVSPDPVVNIFAPSPSPRQPIFKWGIVLTAVLLSVSMAGWWSMRQLDSQTALTEQPLPTPPASLKPQVAGATFGDILKQSSSFADWLAGVNQGSLELINPNNGQQINLLTASNPWYGPIANLYWSPDKSKIATIYLSDKVAQALTDDPAAYARDLGLDKTVSPSTFPYGFLTIIDVVSRQRTTTQYEVKNSPKSIAWLDNNQLAFINSSLQVYDIQAQSLQQVIAAGSTSAQQQLSSPLVWNSHSKSLYFTRTKLLDKQTAHLLSQVSLEDGTVTDITQIQLEQLSTTSLHQMFDMALSSDAKRLALINHQGLAYISLADGAIHQLPYQDNLLWLKQVTLSQLIWLSDHRLAFSGLTLDGQRLWGGWDVEQQLVPAFAKGSSQGAWQVASGQLAVIDNSQSQLHILSPDWTDPSKSSQKNLDISWTAVYW